MANENKSIGRFMLDGILPAQRGIPQIEVTFDIDANGILNVSAKDRGTGKEQRITITASSGLAKDDVERLIQEAEAHADEDHQRKETVETRNMADSAAYTAEKMLRDNKEKISEELHTEVTDKAMALRTALQGEDTSAINAAMNDLQESLQKVGAAVYQQQEGQASEASEGDEAPPEEESTQEEKPPADTVEGEFREV
jgi:molecular chaperone DnaK